MTPYAHIVSGTVREITQPLDADGLAAFSPDMRAQLVPVPAGLAVAQGWTYDGSTFSAPVIAPPTKAALIAYAAVAQAAKLAAGVTVNVAASGSSAVDVLCDGTNPTRADLGLLALYGQQSPTGTKTWIDNNGVVTVLTGAQLVTLATLVGNWIDDTYATLAALLGEISAVTVTTTAAIDAAFAAVTA